MRAAILHPKPGRTRCAIPNGLADGPASIIMSIRPHTGTGGAARHGCGSLSQGPRSTADEQEAHLLQGSRPPQPSFTSHATLAPSRRTEPLPALPAPPPAPWSTLKCVCAWLVKEAFKNVTVAS